MSQMMSYIETQKERVQQFFLLAIFLSLFFPGHAVESITIIGYTSFCLLLAIWKPSRWNLQSIYSLGILYFLYMGITGLWANSLSLYLTSMRIKSSLLALGFCFVVLPKVTIHQLRWIAKWLIIAILISILYIWYQYHIGREQILKEMLQGHPIPVPFRSHIRYNILLNFCLILSLYLSIYHITIKKRVIAWIWILLSVILYGTILFLSVKIGLVISSFILISFFSNQFLRHRAYMKYWMTALLVFFIFIITIYYTTPSIQLKLSYFRWDLHHYSLRDARGYSDGERILSIQQGIEIARRHPYWGVGEGNIRTWLEGKPEDVKLPHNQFVMTWAQNGILGIVLFVGIFIFSIIYAWKKKNWMLLTYTGSLGLACMVEPMIETQLGMAIFVLPLFLLYAYNYESN